MSASNLRPVDHSALATNQAGIILLSLLAFIFNWAWLAAAVAAVMAVGTLLGQPGFGVLYRSILRPAGVLRPNLLLDNPEPHRFAQGLGAVFMGAGALALFAGWSVPGWSLVWLVIFLAGLNLLAGFCAGCAVYYWLGRFNLPGFGKTPPAGSFPGLRSKVRAGNG